MATAKTVHQTVNTLAPTAKTAYCAKTTSVLNAAPTKKELVSLVGKTPLLQTMIALVTKAFFNKAPVVLKIVDPAIILTNKKVFVQLVASFVFLVIKRLVWPVNTVCNLWGLIVGVEMAGGMIALTTSAKFATLFV